MTDFSEAYELISKEELSDIGSTGYLYRHKKSGARISIISNDDENKVFSVGFRTPPADSTGVAHIIEHSVLCGSEKYPVKDPFIELVKGSLNTFLNAMTYPDKTVYPVASCNDADFANLMSVYMDAVFFPDIYNKKEIFLQEGWHYELEDKDAPLTINGVVYNEMRGVFSSPDQLLSRFVQRALFPDTTYGNESGGEPSDIPKLTYEAFLDFHRRYYHPSNSYIYMYGDMDITERLMWMDREYLSKFDKITIDSVIPKQKPFSDVRYCTDYYSAQNDEEKAYLSYNCVVDTSLNDMYQVAFQILSYALVQVPGAPVKQALLDAGIGEEISCTFDGEIYQPVFSIVAKEADENRAGDFVNIIRNELERISEEGIDKGSLKAALAAYEFRYREADFGRYPKGLMYGLSCMQSWLYDDNKPFSAVLLNDIYAELNRLVDTDYFEKLIKEYLLYNTHMAVVNVFPEKGLSKKLDDKLAEELSQYKKTLSDEELDSIAAMTKHLHEYQEAPESPEALKTIPMLTIDDIDKKAPHIPIELKEENGIPVLYHDIRTNGIAYVIMSFDVKEYKDYIQYINLLTYILTYVDTAEHEYLDLSNIINLKTGGFTFNLNVLPKKDEDYDIRCELCFSALYSKLSDTFELLSEIVGSSVIDNKKRLKEIIQEAKADIKSGLEANGNTTAVERGLSYLSEGSYYQARVSSVGFYRFLDDLYKRYDDCADRLIDILSGLVQLIFNKNKMLINITAEEEGYDLIKDELLHCPMLGKDNDKITLPETIINVSKEFGKHNEGFKTSGKVQYVARVGNFKKHGYDYTGSLQVLKTILSYDYLWIKIRLQGGAYGTMCGFVRNGNSYFVSYRDPNLSQTNEVYKILPEYIEGFDGDVHEMTKYIIGTMSILDAPMTPRIKGRVSYTRYISGISYEDMQKERDEILSSDALGIRKLSEYIKTILSDECICVVGGADKIEQCSDMFIDIEDLI